MNTLRIIGNPIKPVFLDRYKCEACGGTGKTLHFGRQVRDCECCQGAKTHLPNLARIQSAHAGWPLCDECFHFYAPPRNDNRLCIHCERQRQRVIKARIMERIGQ